MQEKKKKCFFSSWMKCILMKCASLFSQTVQFASARRLLWIYILHAATKVLCKCVQILSHRTGNWFYLCPVVCRPGSERNFVNERRHCERERYVQLSGFHPGSCSFSMLNRAKGASGPRVSQPGRLARGTEATSHSALELQHVAWREPGSDGDHVCVVDVF